MIVLGIDPGIQRENPCGVALVDVGVSMEVRHVVEVLPGKGIDRWSARVGDIVSHIFEHLCDVGTELIAVETPVLAQHSRPDGWGGRITQVNPLSHGHLWALVGAIAAAAWARGIALVEVTPSEVKTAAGYAHADKAAMISAAGYLVDREISSHEADAIFIASAGAAKHAASVMAERFVSGAVGRRKPGRPKGKKRGKS